MRSIIVTVMVAASLFLLGCCASDADVSEVRAKYPVGSTFIWTFTDYSVEVVSAGRNGQIALPVGARMKVLVHGSQRVTLLLATYQIQGIEGISESQRVVVKVPTGNLPEEPKFVKDTAVPSLPAESPGR